MCRITDNIGLVYNEANKININNKLIPVYDKEDIVSIGTLGLIKANNTYQSDKGSKFATYATHCIRNEIYMTLAKENKKPFTSSFDIDTEDNNLSETIYNSIDNVHIDDSCYIKDIIMNMDKDNKYIICSYYGLYGYKKISQKEIGKVANITQKNVSVRIKRIIRDTQRKLHLEFKNLKYV